MLNTCSMGLMDTSISASISEQAIGPIQGPPTATIPGTRLMAAIVAIAVISHFKMKLTMISFRFAPVGQSRRATIEKRIVTQVLYPRSSRWIPSAKLSCLSLTSKYW